MSKHVGEPEYRNLVQAYEHNAPACRDDWRYIQDREEIDDNDLDQMARTCRTCPLFALCDEYARTAKPNAGMWAGRYWGRKGRPPK